MKSAKSRLYPTDRIVIGYCALTFLLIILFGRPFGDYLNELAFYAGIGALALVITRYVDESQNRLSAFVRLLYPAILFTAFYSMTQGLMFLFTDKFQDPQLVALEQALFGHELTLLIDRTLPNTVLTELLSFCYFGYYLLIPGFFITIFVRRDDRIIREATAAICLTFFASYLIFSAYPIEGPRWYLADQYLHSVDGPAFRQLVDFVIERGAVRGGCMPSTHTAVALVILLFCFKYYRRAGWTLLPFVVGLMAGTVWGRFHYISDVYIGALIGYAAFWLISKYHGRWIMCTEKNVERSEVAKAHVS